MTIGVEKKEKLVEGRDGDGSEKVGGVEGRRGIFLNLFLLLLLLF